MSKRGGQWPNDLWVFCRKLREKKDLKYEGVELELLKLAYGSKSDPASKDLALRYHLVSEGPGDSPINVPKPSTIAKHCRGYEGPVLPEPDTGINEDSQSGFSRYDCDKLESLLNKLWVPEPDYIPNVNKEPANGTRFSYEEDGHGNVTLVWVDRRSEVWLRRVVFAFLDSAESVDLENEWIELQRKACKYVFAARQYPNYRLMYNIVWPVAEVVKTHMNTPLNVEGFSWIEAALDLDKQAVEVGALLQRFKDRVNDVLEKFDWWYKSASDLQYR